jgi:hypothetical protein
MKHISVLTLFALLTVWAGLALATGKNNTTINNYYDYPTYNYYDNDATTITSGVDSDDLSEAVAKSAACGANFYYGTNKKQGAVHGAYYDGESEICFEAAWRPKDSAVMWDVGIVPDEDSDLILWRGGVQFEF